MTTENILQAGTPISAPLQIEPNLRQRILVVEDDADIRRLNTEVLIYSGYQVDSAEDGAAAWDALQLKNYNLMVTDNEMPKVTGVELILKLQAARMALPVVLATGTLPDYEFTRYGSLQPAMLLLKPYTFEDLVAAVKEVLCWSIGNREEIALAPNWPTHPLANRIQL